MTHVELGMLNVHGALLYAVLSDNYVLFSFL